ncbi:MAG: class I SAM-dependent methyltransferase, partial [Planctomycetes bacterium]|nr:class I SAM-dependent methyltransferase [Planctomycetota bacterium]
MKIRKVFNSCLVAVVVFVMCQMALRSVALAGAYENPAAKPAARVDSTDNNSKDRPRESKERRNANQKERAKSIRAIVSHLGVGKGSVIADIGAGSGKDTWVFAEIVGETGKVFAEEISEDKVESLKDAADTKGFGQVRAVLGSSDDPCLPRDSVDLVYMNRVYHHFARPREMLRGIWRSLRPGGYLVIVDQRRGTLQDWVPRQLREEKHFWIAETTVVREAREEGFAFAACLEHFWHEEKGFVLVFQRPEKLKSPGHDPDAFHPISVEKFSRLFRSIDRPYQKPVFVALGEARKLIPMILDKSSGEGLEIVLEEWATQKEERPPLPDGISMPSVLTENGDPN